MKIAIGMDVHDAKCAVCAVFAGRGQAKTSQLEFLYPDFDRLIRF